ncbi:hypothetical protein OCA5_c27620 [Afipia carboxidovorans OM5]|uniref:Uncharacterized protein n=1 Tax=Afipia carboxidovorans (strain ATCC 49405 / DSM 1227 / KCTC 32145 / OM5) TaxID=504832 RepID=F8BVP3_AFIC5|nr:hypothetical protein [Afipia carboxidovorans]AEI03879.1 hypothetical protein OCA4_c27610 [Afipia carboxidovorans OM4]AEI07456.1 hypothetical protein OCA5_c27620 [Afipia carboxidovorans OM5]
MRISIISTVIACMMAGTATQALAQAAPAPSTPQAPTATNPDRATNCAPTQTAPGKQSVEPSRPPHEAGKPLGDTLAQSDGVLCPPTDVDPAMRAPPPDSGSSSMPVLPPPGSPGGAPNVRPK